MTAARPSSNPNNPPGATPVGGGNRGNGRKRGLLLGALLAGLLLLAALLLSQCGSDDPEGGSDEASRSTSSDDASSSRSSGSAGSSSPSASPSPSRPAGAAGGGAGQGQGQIVTADGRSVLELAAGPDAAAALGGLSGQAVTGTAVQVLSVPADEGFWVGSSDQDRVWVQLTGAAGESPYQVTEGDVVDFEGTVVAHDASFAGTVGVDEANGAAQLTEQASHIEVAKGSVALAG